MLTMVTVQWDINNPVGVTTTYTVDSVKMYRTAHSFGVFIFIFELGFILYTWIFTYIVLKSICKKKRAYFRSVWSLLDIGVIFVSFVVIFLHALYAYFISIAVKEYEATKSIDLFHHVVRANYAVTYGLGFLVALSALKFLHMLRFNPVIYLLLVTLNQARSDLLTMALVMPIFYLMFASLLHLLTGHWVEAFRSLPRTMMSLMGATLKNVDFRQLKEIHPFWGPFPMFIFFAILFYVIANLLAGVICNTVRNVFRQPQGNEEAQLLRLLINKLLIWFGIKKS